jgi:hypothetical protein
MTATDPLDPRVAELLSAYLDGAVTEEEREVAAAWLERSPEARAEYESLASVKAALGGLGEVDPPFGFYDRMLRQGTPTPEVTSAVTRSKRGRRWVLAGGAVIAAAAAFVVVAGPSETVTPPVSQVAAGEVGTVLALQAGGPEARALSQEADAVRWDELPDGRRSTEGGAETWTDLTTEGDEEHVVVYEEGVVVTLAAEDVDAEDLIAAGRQVAEDEAADPGLSDRVEDLAEAIWPG